MTEVDLANAAVFFDFDGTISTVDIGLHLLERLASPGWHDYGHLFDAGEIGSRECMELEWASIPDDVTEAERHAVAAEITLDPAFGPLVDGLRAAGAELAVVSDGFGFYVHDFVAPFGVPVFTNEVDVATNTLRYPHAGQGCASCSACGTCKPQVIEAARARGLTAVFVGDGISDRHAARVADVLFAKAGLARWCADEGITHTHFDTLADVTAVLLAQR